MVHQGGSLPYDRAATWRIPHAYYDARRAEIQAASGRQGKENAGLIPSTGYRTARWLLENGAAKLTLAGFDHFSRAAKGQHHYWDPHVFLPPPEHDGEAEARLLQPYLADGRLSYLA